MGGVHPVVERVMGALGVTVVACLPSPLPEDGDSSTTVAARCGIWHPDDDGDGFGSAALAIDTCNPEPSWVMDDRDCYDGNADARPDQTAYFGVHRGDEGFDYDCDGFSTVELREVGGCYGVGCPADEGWRSGLTACGAVGDYVTDCGRHAEDAQQCAWTFHSRRQRCR